MTSPDSQLSPIALMQLEDRNDDEPSAFESLPAELRRNIYEELLKAENVRQAPDQDMICQYHFETAILGVNKKIHNEAWSILYRDNHFVTVSCDWPHISKSFVKYHVAAISVSKPKVVAKFKEPPTLASQKAVLEHFRCLRLGTEGLTITGVADPVYVRDWKTTIGSTIVWVRGTAWEMYDKVLSLKMIADEAFALGNWDTASTTHKNCLEVLETIHQKYPIISEIPYEDFGLAFSQLVYSLEANLNQVMVHRRLWREVMGKTGPLVDIDQRVLSRMPAPFKCRMYFYRAIALAATHREEEANHVLLKAAMLDPLDDIVKCRCNSMDRRLKAKSEADRAAAGTIFSNESLSELGGSLQFPSPTLNPQDSIAGERYLLRQLGYKGDYLEAIKERTPVDLEEMAEAMKDVEKHKAQLAPGTPFRAWVLGGQKAKVMFESPCSVLALANH